MKHINMILLLLILTIFSFAGWHLYNIGLFSSPESKVVKIAPQLKSSPAGDSSQRLQMPPRHPVMPPRKVFKPEGAQPVEPPLPTSLDQGDAYLKARLPQLTDQHQLLQIFVLEHFIQKLVLVIDQLPNKHINRQHLPVRPPSPGFVISGSGEKLFIGKKNAARYKPYIELAEAIPDRALLRLYRGLYPLFQKAYRETGHPRGHFNDRLIQVIDHLLQAPEPADPIALVPHVQRYKYADESLESLSAGQKILLRMGNENSRRIKAKLLSLQQGLVRQN